MLEVLIVLAIVGIVTGALGLGIRSAGHERKLRIDAQRLVQLFTLAQAEARRTGQPLAWQFDEQGYRFHPAPRDFLLPAALSRHAPAQADLGVDPAGPLRPRAWTSERPVQVRVDPPKARVFHDEWISGPRTVELDDGLAVVRLQRQGNGQYRVVQ